MQPTRYAEIASSFEKALQAKTSWGRKEALNLLKDVLLKNADEELASIKPVGITDIVDWQPDYSAYDKLPDYLTDEEPPF